MSIDREIITYELFILIVLYYSERSIIDHAIAMEKIQMTYFTEKYLMLTSLHSGL